MKHAILKRLRTIDRQPFIFVGSGFSIRYLGLENWEGLLRKFAHLAADKDYAYEMYIQQAKASECREGLLPKVAELIERDFNIRWFSDERYQESREEYADDVRRSVSPFKIEIAKYMNERSQNHKPEYAEEIQLLKQLEMRSISGILTTNYDSFLEDLFSSYTKYVGQEELIFSTLQGVSEIYKIHGCCSKPETIVINESDYVDFSERNAYLAAKILTIFLEHPVVFIGYSISDKNIEAILKAVVQCLSAKNLELLKERLIFVERAKEGETEEISTYSKSFEGGKSIDMTRVKIRNYEVLYQAMLDNQAKYNAPMLRRLKQDIYELVLTNKPTGRIRTVNLEDEKLEDVEVVVGVGVIADFGQKGYAGITAEELYFDLVLDNRDFEADSIVRLALPTLLARNSNLLPIHKYLASVTGEIPERVANSVKKEFDDLLCGTIKKSRENCAYREDTITSLRQKYPANKCLQALPNLKEENIDITEMDRFLKDILEEVPNILTDGATSMKSDFKRAVRIYDWIRYHK